MEQKTEQQSARDEKYLQIHTIDTLNRVYQSFAANKEADHAAKVADKISALIKQIAS